MFKTTLVLYCCFVIVSVSGWELQSSMEKQLDGNIQVRFGRFLVWTTTTTSTSFTLIFTQLLTTYRSVSLSIIHKTIRLIRIQKSNLKKISDHVINY